MIETEGCIKCGNTLQDVDHTTDQPHVPVGRYFENGKVVYCGEYAPVTFTTIRCACGHQTLPHPSLRDALKEWNIINQHVTTPMPRWFKWVIGGYIVTMAVVGWMVS